MNVIDVSCGPRRVDTVAVVQEFMNIAVGRAAGEIEGLFRFTLDLTVPRVIETATENSGDAIQAFPQPTKTIASARDMAWPTEAPTTNGVAGSHISGCTTASITQALPPCENYWIIEQEFFGSFDGASYLIASPEGLSGLSLFSNHPVEQARRLDTSDALLQHATLEIGSVLMSSCIAAFADLTDSPVQFGIPRFRATERPADHIVPPRHAAGSLTIACSRLAVEQCPVELDLFIMLPETAVERVRAAAAGYA